MRLSPAVDRGSTIKRFDPLNDTAGDAPDQGRHRQRALEDTLATLIPHLRAIGVTRLAELTGLDRIQMPVWAAIRPNARSIVGAQGKGLTVTEAKIGAIAEAIEAHASETLAPVSTKASIRARGPYVMDLAGLVEQGCLDPDRPLSWVEGSELMTGGTVMVPFDLVHLDFTRPLELIGWTRQTTGLGAGNDRLEAVLQGLYELIERDAYARFVAISPRDRRRFGLGDAADPRLDLLVSTLATAVVKLTLFDATTDLGVPVVIARLLDEDGERAVPFGPTFGAGCHLWPEIAVIRAITEAIQGRATHIAASRDDIGADQYSQGPRARLLARMQDVEARDVRVHLYGTVPAMRLRDRQADLDFLLARLSDRGLPSAVVVDAPCVVPQFHVVRVVVPGLGRQHGSRHWVARPSARGLH